MRKYFVFLGIALVVAPGFGIHRSSAQANSQVSIPSVVRIDIRDSNDKLLGFGTGVIIDADGRVLTNERTIRKWKQTSGAIAYVCLAKNEIDPPTCSWKARLLNNNEGMDLALLQINQANIKGEWMSMEEYVLRTKFAFSPIKTDFSVIDTEGVRNGDRLTLFNYLQTGATSISQTRTQVIGFAQTTQNGKNAPSIVRVESAVSMQNVGGILLNENGTLMGIATKTSGDGTSMSSYTSLAVVNQYVNNVYGPNYLSRKFPMLLTGSLNGTLGGTLQTSVCPLYSSKSGKEMCHCNDGFYAVGNSCILGQTYCTISYGVDAKYDAGLKTCICLEKDGRHMCTKKITAPVTTTTPSIPVQPKTFTCPTNATYNPTSWTCECDKGYVRDTKLNACKKV